MESFREEILQEIRNLTKSVQSFDKKVDSLGRNVDRKLGKLSTKVEVTGSALVEMVGVLDKLNTNSYGLKNR